MPSTEAIFRIDAEATGLAGSACAGASRNAGSSRARVSGSMRRSIGTSFVRDSFTKTGFFGIGSRLTYRVAEEVQRQHARHDHGHAADGAEGRHPGQDRQAGFDRGEKWGVDVQDLS